MAYSDPTAYHEFDDHAEDLPLPVLKRKRLTLGRSRRRLSFERALRLWLYLMGLPAFGLIAIELWQHQVDSSIVWITLPATAFAWMFLVSLVMDRVIRPLQTLANVVAALREDDYSFRARGARRNDAMGDLALEINALAGMLQVQRVGAMEAMALVERVMKSMQSPVLAFDPDGKLKLLNAAAERAFNLLPRGVQRSALRPNKSRLDVERLLRAEDNDVLSVGDPPNTERWVVKRSKFRLRGIPHTLFVLSDVSEALREEERLAWKRLIRVMGHEINNSLTPIKSIAESLRSRFTASRIASEDDEDFARGLEVIEDRADSLNRFLQAYRELTGLPAPKTESISLAALIGRITQLETRLPVTVRSTEDVPIEADPDQLAHALINLVRNAAEAALSADAQSDAAPRIGTNRLSAPCEPTVEVTWETAPHEVVITILDNGPGLTNADNLFVPFYTTKPQGTGIGLVLAQQIAQGHGGSVQLSNRTDTRGCRASLRLPLRPLIREVR